MPSRTDDIVLLMNRLANIFKRFVAFNKLDFSLYTAVKEYQQIYDYVRKKFEEVLSCEEPEEGRVQALLTQIDAILYEQTEVNRVIRAMAIVQDIDSRIVFEKNDNPHFISLSDLVKMVPDTEDVMKVAALNTNAEETGIVIHPKYPVSHARVLYDQWTDRSFSVRGIQQGLNARLSHLIYFPAAFEGRSGESYSYQVYSLIMPERRTIKPGENRAGIHTTKIGFTPISDDDTLLVTEQIPAEKMTHTIRQIPYEGIAVKAIRDPEKIEKRFERAFYEACKHDLDVFCSVEMLCTNKMKEVTGGQSDYLKDLIRKAKLEGLSVPRLILMPTRWEDKSNYLLIFDENGTLLGKQYKRTPYVDEKNGRVEALDLSKATNEIYLIHLKNRQRIAVVICAEFLANLEYVRDFLCGWLCVTMILVPSYSKGEQDFVASLPIYNNYGVSVVWGDCCGAVKTQEGGKRIIGGCSYAGTDKINRLGDWVDCQFNCRGKPYCLFKLEFETSVEQEKPGSPDVPIVRHYCF